MAGMLMKMACVVMACMVVLELAPHAAEAITCGQITTSLVPCIQYLRGPSNAKVPPSCCNGVKGLNSAAKTTADKKTACGCLKSSYNSIPGIVPANAAGLPGKCGVNIPYKISPTTDCTKIQ